MKPSTVLLLCCLAPQGVWAAATQAIASGDLLRAAEASLQKSLAPYAGHYALEPLGHLSDFVTLAGQVELRPSAPAGDLLRPRLAVPVAVFVNGRQSGSVAVWFSLSVQEPALIAARDLPAGSEITTADVRSQDVDLTRLGGMAVTSVGQLAGLSLREPVSGGGTLLAAEFEPTPDVRRDQEVRVELRSGSITVIAEGKAAETGRTGDLISVLVDGADGACQGRVIGKGVVQVEY